MGKNLHDRFVETGQGFFIEGVHTDSYWENLFGGTSSSVTFMENKGKGVLIDAGAGEELLEFVIGKIRERRVDLIYLILTHDHYDHVENGRRIAEQFSCKVLAHPSDAPIIENPLMVYDSQRMYDVYGRRLSKTRDEMNALPEWGWKQKLTAKLCHNFALNVDGHIQDGDIVQVGDLALEVYHTPGHSPGSICLFDPQSGVLHVGDLDYWFNPTRPYPIGNAKDLLHSLEKVKRITACSLYRGHYPIIEGREQVLGHLDGCIQRALSVENRILSELAANPRGLSILELANQIIPALQAGQRHYYFYRTSRRYFRGISSFEGQIHSFLIKLRDEEKVASFPDGSRTLWKLT